MTENAPVISVVIPTLDEVDALKGVLESARGPGVERIVVDGGSSDATVDRARELGAERVLATASGRAAQLERGLRAARGAYVLFLHADTRLPDDWHVAVRSALADPQVAGGAFRLRFDTRDVRYRWVERGARLRALLFGLPYGDQALFVRRELLERAGGVPQVPIFEDLDLTRIIRRRGRLALLTEPALTSPRRYQRYGVGRMLVRNNLALAAWALGLPRARVARWYRGA